MMNRLIPFFLFTLFALGTGCATQRVLLEDKPLNETRLFVTKSGEDVTLSWDSNPDYSYSILYNHTRSSKSPWKVLPGFDMIRGTGRQLSYSDRVPPNTERYYRLQTYPAVSLSP